MLIFNLHYQLALRISGNMQHKNTFKCKIPIVPEEGWFDQPKYGTPSKKFYAVSVSTFIFFIIYRLGAVGAEDFRLKTVKFS